MAKFAGVVHDVKLTFLLNGWVLTAVAAIPGANPRTAFTYSTAQPKTLSFTSEMSTVSAKTALFLLLQQKSSVYGLFLDTLFSALRSTSRCSDRS
jgi:hypothetical protein